MPRVHRTALSISARACWLAAFGLIPTPMTTWRCKRRSLRRAS
jgi:hypothetical protein